MNGMLSKTRVRSEFLDSDGHESLNIINSDLTLFFLLLVLMLSKYR